MKSSVLRTFLFGFFLLIAVSIATTGAFAKDLSPEQIVSLLTPEDAQQPAGERPLLNMEAGDIGKKEDAYGTVPVVRLRRYSSAFDVSDAEAGRDVARMILYSAADKSVEMGLEESAEFFNEIAGILAYSPIVWPEPDIEEFDLCMEDSGILAFVVPDFSENIFLCGRLVSLPDLSLKALGQILIHESVHLAGYRDECAATLIEVRAMQRSGQGLAFRNGYMDKCGIE